MEKIKYNQNQSVFKVGELPDKMFLLVKGTVGIFLPTNETNKPNFIIQENEPLKSELKEFIDCLYSRKSPLTDHKEAVKVQTVMDMIDKKI